MTVHFLGLEFNKKWQVKVVLITVIKIHVKVQVYNVMAVTTEVIYL